MRLKAWVTGAGGLIGHHVAIEASRSAPSWTVVPLRRSDLDLTDAKAVEAALLADKPDVIFHCAAQARSPYCEAHPGEARLANVEATRHLVNHAGPARLLLFSTDQVFDGLAGHYDEGAGVNPLNIYARTKVDAEQIVLAHRRHCVVRTSLNAGRSPTGDRSFTEQLAQARKEGRTLRLFTDEFRNPIHARFTAQAAWDLILQDAEGLFHVAGADRLSRWQIGELLARYRPEGTPPIEPESLTTYQGPPRAPDTTLNCQKAQRILRFPLPAFSEWIRTASHSEI